MTAIGDETPGLVEGHELVVVANRLPVERDASGVLTPSPGGLVTALRSVTDQRRAAWVGWDGSPDAADDGWSFGDTTLRAVALSEHERDDYYGGFSNKTLWPLYHDAVRPPEYRREWWHAYVRVNRRFAAEAAALLAPNGLVWVHDYHLQLVPAMVRELRPDATIGFFLHIPFPPQELFMQLPWREEMLRGLLGADLVGFQEPGAVRNFTRLASRILDVGATDRELWWSERRLRVGAFPISIDVKAVEETARDEQVVRRSASLRRRLGDPATVLLGVDRLDYTKGIDVRLRAFRELLREGRLRPERSVFVQVATPTREDVPDYLAQKEVVERLVGEINGEFAQVGLPVVHYIHRNLDMRELVALYRAADVMVVTPMRDGMNLVAKEYVASRVEDDGVLVLSEFAGAARELGRALLVNPYDIDGLKDALERAASLNPAEVRSRMTALRRSVARHDVHQWAQGFLDSLQECGRRRADTEVSWVR